MATIVDGKTRNRPGRWMVDFRDATGRRKIVTCNSKTEAEREFARVIPLSQQRAGASSFAHDTTLADFAKVFLLQFAATNKSRSHDVYKQNLDRHILPALGAVQIRQVNRTMVTSFVVRLDTLSKASRKLVVAILRAVFAKAIYDNLIQTNPCEGVAKELKLAEAPKVRAQRIGKRAYTEQQISTLLKAAAAAKDKRHYPLFVFLSQTGCRISEAIGLRWSDVNFETNKIAIERAISKGHLEIPKSGHGRVIDMSEALAPVLRKLLADRKADKLAKGWDSIPEPVFCTNVGTPLDEAKCRKALHRIVKAAKLPHFTLHGFRHSLASNLISKGVDSAYVQKMLGHSSVALTVDLYGSHHASETAAVNVLGALAK
jgi:integrase